MNKDNFFSSIRSDRGVLIKQNKKKQLVFSFIGDKGPFNVTFTQENAAMLAECISSMIEEKEKEKEEEQEPPTSIDVAEHVNNFMNFSTESYSTNHELTSHIKKLDPNNHPFFHGHDADKTLTGEEESE